MTEIDQATLDSLADKIGALKLSDGEQAVMDQLLERASAFEPEVEGFASFSYSGMASGADLSPMSFKLGRGSGLIGGGMGGITEITEMHGGGERFRPPPP